MAHDLKTLDVGFINMNFGTGQSKDQDTVDWFLRNYPDLDMLAAVETKVNDFRKMFPAETWKTRQNTVNEGKSNSAVAWLRKSVRNIKVHALKLGANPDGHTMLARWLRVIDFDLWVVKEERWQRCRLVIAHRPPARYKILWPIFDAAVKGRIKTARWSRNGHWAIAADFNEPGKKVAEKLGGKFFGEGIDGFVVGPHMTMRNVDIARVPKQKGWTDHVGVVGTLVATS